MERISHIIQKVRLKLYQKGLNIPFNKVVTIIPEIESDEQIIPQIQSK